MSKVMEVRFKKMAPDAVIPTKAHPSDVGFDMVAVSRVREMDIITYGTGIAVEIPEGYVGLLFPRSSICKTGLSLSNSVGCVDSGYRGEIMFKFRVMWNKLYDIGDRIGQLVIMPYPQVELVEAEALSESDRGMGGYGSTGR